MAEQMQGIQRRIKSIGTTERITNAMKLVSAAKLRKAKSVMEHSSFHLGKMENSIRDVLSHVPKEYLAKHKEIKNKCYIMITSSNGLCGSFNGNVIRAMTEELKAFGNDTEHVKLVCVGSKGADYFAHHQVTPFMEHDAPADSITLAETKDISQPLLKLYRAGEIDEINLVYTAYINTLRQEVTVERILPLDFQEDERAEGGFDREVEYSPSVADVVHYMVPKYVELLIFRACVESAACEHAARRTAMENANDNAKDILSDLRLAYNHARQAVITDEIIEIVAGAEAQR